MTEADIVVGDRGNNSYKILKCRFADMSTAVIPSNIRLLRFLRTLTKYHPGAKIVWCVRQGVKTDP